MGAPFGLVRISVEPPPMAAFRWPFPPCLAVAALALSLAACASTPPPRPLVAAGGTRPRAYNRPYQVRGRWYTPADQPGYDRTGLASWYAYESRSRTTADGEPFDARLATAAHTTLPIPSWLEVTNLDNGRSARVRLNDRGPFVAGRILDVSQGAAEALGFRRQGTARVRVRYLGPAEPLAGGAGVLWATAPRRAADPLGRRETPIRLAQIGSEPTAPRSPSFASDAQPPRMEPGAPGDRMRPATAPTMAMAEVDKDLADFSAASPDAPGPRPPAAPIPDAGEGGYAVQVGAFASRENAERAAAELATTGQARILPLQRGDGATLYRVLIGDLPGQGAAQAMQAAVAARGFGAARVIGER